MDGEEMMKPWTYPRAAPRPGRELLDNSYRNRQGSRLSDHGGGLEGDDRDR